MRKVAVSLLSCFTMLIVFAECSTVAFAAGSAPVADNMEINTCRNNAVEGILSAADPEDDVVSYEITTGPIKGKIELASDGKFVYTPNEGKKGRDYFGYKAKDSQGNLSQEATVIIRIKKECDAQQ